MPPHGHSSEWPQSKGSQLTDFVHPALLSSTLLPSHTPPSTHREAGMSLRWGAAGSLPVSSQEDVVDKGSCEAKQLVRRLGLAHRPNTAFLYLTQKTKESCQKNLHLCNFDKYKITAISVCHFHTAIHRIRISSFKQIQLNWFRKWIPEDLLKQEFKSKKKAKKICSF